MQTAKSAETALGDPQALQVRKHDLAGIPHDDPLDLALAIDEDSHLTVDLARDLGELTGELLGDELPRWNSPLVELQESLALLSLEPCDVAFELMNRKKTPYRLYRATLVESLAATHPGGSTMKRFATALALSAGIVAMAALTLETAEAAAAGASQSGYRGRSHSRYRGSYGLRYRSYWPSYRGYGYYRYGYGYGYGYGYPYYRYRFGYGWPYGWGLGVGLGYGFGYPYYSYYSPYYYGYRGQRYRYDDRGAKDYDHYRAGIRVRVSPKETEVYVDGFYAGTVDEFDGTFQRLYVDPGEREIVLRLEGYEIETRRLHVQSGRTVNISHTMTPLPEGQSTPPPPEPESARIARRDSYRRPLVRDRDRDRPREPESEPEQEREQGPAIERRTYSSRVPERDLETRPARFGKLVVRVQPSDVDIYIDGRLWGSADGFDQLVVHLTAGAHRIEFRRAGHDVFSEEVMIEPGMETPLNVRLDGIR
jgi:hypothetical protein